MARYTMRTSGLYNRHNQRIAVTRGESIYDVDNRRIGGVRGNELFDTNDSVMMRIHGGDILDAKNVKVATLSEAEESIEGAGSANLLAALWYCFVR